MDINLSKLLNIIRKNLIFIITFALCFLIAAFIVSKYFIPPKYSTSTKLYVDTSSESQTINLNDLNYAQKVVNTYIEMINTDNFFTEVKNNISLNMSLNDIKKSLTFKVVNNTEIFSITAKTDLPEKSKILADTASSTAVKTIEKLKQSADLNIVAPAPIPASPSSPNLKLNSLIGLISGLVISFIIVLLRDIFDIKIKNESDLKDKYNIPILGVIPYYNEEICKVEKRVKKNE